MSDKVLVPPPSRNGLGDDTGRVAGILMAIEALFVFGGGSCAGLYGGLFAVLAGVQATQGGSTAFELALFGAFGLIKLVVMLLCLGSCALLALGSRNLIQGEPRLVRLASVVALLTPVLMLGSSVLTCSTLEAMIWTIPTMLGLVVGVLGLQVRPEVVRQEW